jgi:hypothetical protein
LAGTITSRATENATLVNGWRRLIGIDLADFLLTQSRGTAIDFQVSRSRLGNRSPREN